MINIGYSASGDYGDNMKTFHLFAVTRRVHAKLALLSSAVLLSGCSDMLKLAYIPSAAQLEVVEAPAPAITDYSRLGLMSQLDAGKLPLGAQSRYSVYVRNKGDLPGILKSFSVEPPEAASVFSVKTGCRIFEGKHGDLCIFNVTFDPDALGPVQASLHINYDNGRGQEHVVKLPLLGNANNLALLTFESDLLDLKTDTIGYAVSGTLKVIYNGAHFQTNGFSIKPAMGVVLASPSNAQFTVDPTGTTCGNQISADCFVKIQFAATSVGAQSAKFNISYFNGAESLSTSASLIGTGLAGVTLATLSAPTTSFGNVVFNPPAPKTVSIPVTFSGSVPATGVKITAPTNPAFTLSTNPAVSTCFASATINGNCTLSVSFNPTSRMAYASSIGIEYSSNQQARPNVTIALSGSGVNPAQINLSAVSHDFGSVPAFKPNSKAITLTNAGEVAVSSLSALALTDSTNFSASFQSTCGTLAPNASCTLNLGFTPRSAAAMSSTVSFSYSNGRETVPLSVALTGTGTAPAVMSLNGSNVIDFGNIMIGANPANIAAKTTTVNFYGTTNITTASQLTATPSSLSSPFAFNGASALFPGGGTCVPPLNAASVHSCTFASKLTTTTAGMVADTAKTQNFSVAYAGDGNQGSGTLSYTVKMTPRVPPTLSFTQPAASFGTVSANDSATIVYTVHNDSPYFATSYVSAAIVGDSAFTISANSCTGGLAANANCSVTIRFLPTAAASYSGSLSFVYSNQLANQTITTPFTGTGTGDVRLVLQGSSTVAFGNVFIGDTIPQKSVTLKYYGLKTWTPNFTIAAPYTIDASTCGAAADCVLRIAYTPTVAGAANNPATLSYSPANSPNGTASISLSVTGTAAARSALLAASPLSFAKTVQGSTLDRVITITNSGSASAQGVVPSIDAATSPAYTIQPSDASMSNPCSSSVTLASGQTCQVKVRLAPTTELGAVNGSLLVAYKDLASSQNKVSTFALSGTGTIPIQVFAGFYQTCLINELRQVLCWGNNSYGQSGLGNDAQISGAPQALARVNLGTSAVVRKLAVGSHHVCALYDLGARRGAVTCWGDNANGRLGLGTLTPGVLLQPRIDSNTNNPIAIDLGSDGAGPLEVADIAAGFEHSCALLHDGRVKCWGGNSSGQLGLGHLRNIGSAAADMGNSLSVVDLKGVVAVDISAGAGHTCAALVDGSAKCWGDNFYGQLGQGSDVSSLGGAPGEMAALKPISLGTGAQAVSVLASAGAFSCVTLASGAVKCFGKGVYNENTTNAFFGVLGACWARPAYNASATVCASNPGLTPSNAYGYLANDMGDHLPVINWGAVGGVAPTAVKLAVGNSFSCVLTNDKNVRCWGANDRGQLGNGTLNHVGDSPDEMGNNLGLTLANVGSVAAGAEHACAVLNANNTVKCWGSSTENAMGLKGLGIAGDVTAPGAAPVVYDGNL